MDQKALPDEEEKNNNVSAHFPCRLDSGYCMKIRKGGAERNAAPPFAHQQSRSDKSMVSMTRLKGSVLSEMRET